MAGRDSVIQLIEILRRDPASIMLREGAHKDMYIARAPARLEVIGAAADAAGGLTCALPLELSTAVAVQKRDDRKLVLRRYGAAVDHETNASETLALSLDDFYGTAALLPNDTLQALFSGSRRWAMHAAGAFPILARHKKITRRTAGANIACFCDAPTGVGLGTSTALGCATLFALTAAYHLILEPLEIATLAQKLSGQFTGIGGGMADPMTCIFGKQNHLLVTQIHPPGIKACEPVPPGYAFAGIIVPHEAATDSAQRRNAQASAWIAQAIMARFYQDIGIKKDPTKGALAQLPPALFTRYFRHILPEAISGETFRMEYGLPPGRAVMEAGTDYHPRAAAEYHVKAFARTEAFMQRVHAMNELAADARTREEHALALGALMREPRDAYARALQQAGGEDDLLWKLAVDKRTAQDIYGATISGGNQGRTMTLLIKESAAARAEVQAIADKFQQQSGIAGQVVWNSSGGLLEVPPLQIAPPPPPGA